MNRSSRITIVVSTAAATLAGAGFALANTGTPPSTSAADVPSAIVAVDAVQQDGPNLNGLALELARLGDRSSHLGAMLADVRARTEQVVARNGTVIRTTAVADVTASGTEPSSPSQGPSAGAADHVRSSDEADESDEHADDESDHESDHADSDRADSDHEDADHEGDADDD